MVIKIADLRKEINREEQKKASELEAEIDKILRDKKEILFNLGVSVFLGKSDYETLRICKYLKQTYQEKNPELNIEIHGALLSSSLISDDLKMELNFKINPEYLI